MIADKLNKAVMDGSSAQVALYAPLLASNENITVLSDTTIFDDEFYDKAINMVSGGPSYAGHNMAVLLRKLHDPKALIYVFAQFAKSDNPRVRNLLLSILEGFEQERNKPVREKIINWLKENQTIEKSPVVQQSIRESIKRFNKK